MKRKLAPNTIVPQSLYVERKADKQIAELISDMGRPGYVLVARQMGKTNLLIAAKRNLESDQDIFAYVDLSNRFETERECFRSIIDKILDGREESLGTLDSVITKSRIAEDRAPHIEHARELRAILNAISGKLVIILDEIDSLTAADYSDKIFALIRSIYFERVNHQELERLTYIISGVAEPTEIIKDKSISPFNIGQKILLGDFTKSEYRNFLNSASLCLGEDVADRIFYWANGNPRLTWEICSSVEERLIDGELESTEMVDRLVKDLYFNKFDRPPVDHIRALVKADKEIRKALVSIHYDKGDTLTDEIKNRLYLSGILGTSYEYGDVVIKNRVIEECLNERWLSEIEEQTTDSLQQGVEFIKNGNYEKASEVFYDMYVDENKIDGKNSLAITDYLSLSYFHTANYPGVVSCLEDGRYDKKGQFDRYIDQSYRLGVSYSFIDQKEKALKVFEEIVDEQPENKYYESLISSAMILSSYDDSESQKKSLLHCQIILDDVASGLNLRNEVIALTHYNLAVINQTQSKGTAVLQYIEASRAGDNAQKITPLVEAFKIEPSKASSFINEIVEILMSGDIKLDTYNVHALSFTKVKLFELLSILSDCGLDDEIEKVITVIGEFCLNSKHEMSRLLFDLGHLCLSGKRKEHALYYFKKSVSQPRELSTPEAIFDSNKYLAVFDDSQVDALNLYLKGFQNYVQVPSIVDVLLFERKVTQCVTSGDTGKAIKYCDLIIKSGGTFSGFSRETLLPIFYWRMILDKEEYQKHQYADLIISTLAESEGKKDDKNYFTASHESYKKAAMEIVNIASKVETYVRAERKYGRNDIVTVTYLDGRSENKKYKLVSESISQGLCSLSDPS